MMGLGSVSDFNLKEARERARAARQLLADGLDPLEHKHVARAAARLVAAKKLIFRDAAQRYFDQNEAKWKSASHRDQFLASLRTHAFPQIGSMDVAMITLADVLRAIEPIWTTKSVTADRVRNRIEAVLDWCVVRGHRPHGTNPARWKGHLDHVLPAARKVAPIVHHNAMDYHEAPAFMIELRHRNGVAARALEFLILTAARAGEVLGARWDEVDLDAATWVIPAARMKAHREHRVALSAPAIQLLRALPSESANTFVFVGSRSGRGLGRMAMRRVLERMGRTDTVHGFRSSFSDWAHEQTAHSNHTIEISLAHNIGTETERAYRRKDMFAKRVRLMADWATYCTTPPVTRGNVIALWDAR
jgi:integrase